MKTFYLGRNSKSMDDFFLKGVVSLLPVPKKQPSLSLVECKNELAFLTTITTANLEHFIKRLNQAKLAHIRGILRSSEPSIEKDVLIDLLDGKMMLQNGIIIKTRLQVEEALEQLNA